MLIKPLPSGATSMPWLWAEAIALHTADRLEQHCRCLCRRRAMSRTLQDGFPARLTPLHGLRALHRDADSPAAARRAGGGRRCCHVLLLPARPRHCLPTYEVSRVVHCLVRDGNRIELALLATARAATLANRPTPQPRHRQNYLTHRSHCPHLRQITLQIMSTLVVLIQPIILISLWMPPLGVSAPRPADPASRRPSAHGAVCMHRARAGTRRPVAKRAAAPTEMGSAGMSWYAGACPSQSPSPVVAGRRREVA